jgi:hypothetical protein
MKLSYLIELVVGTTVFLFSLMGCVILTNKITHFLVPGTSKSINPLILSLHLIIIVACVIGIRSLFFKYMKNKDIVYGIFGLTGPIIALSSIYMSDTIHALVA